MQCSVIFLVSALCLATTGGTALAQQPTQPGWPQPVTNNALYSYTLLDQLEARTGSDDTSFRWSGEGWYGTNYNRFWYKSEGETAGDGSLDEAEAQALYAHSISRYFDVQVGVRQAFKPSPSRTWAAFGVEGLAPYFFDLDATAFVSDDGYYAGRLEGRYELLFTQRLILEPQVEINVYSKSDRARGIGAGLSDLDSGFRLRYEIRREFAPYIGVTYEDKFGKTATYARARGEPVGQLRFTVGVRAFF